MEIVEIDFESLFKPEFPLAEAVFRGSVLYVGILLLMRILPRRTGGEMEVMDLIFVILIAEAASHALGDYTSLTEGFVVIITLMALNYLVNMLSYRFPVIEKLVSAPPMQIVKDGKMLRRNMRREYLTEAELKEHLRTQGIDDVTTVKKAMIESDGTISVIRKK